MSAPVVVMRSAALGLHGLGGTVRLRTSRCAYLGDGNGWWAVVHDDTLAITPGSIVVASGRTANAERAASPLHDAAFLAAGAAVRLAWGRLHSPGAELLVGAAPCWTAPAVQRGGADHAAPRRLTAVLAAQLPPGSEELGRRLDGVLHALEHAGDDGLDAALDRLIGYGQGLTPAGDDVIVGLLAVAELWPAVLGAAETAHRVRAGIVQRLATTTDCSAFYLRHAMAGRFGQAVLAVRDAFALGDVTELAAASQRLLAVGASSGADLLTGLLAGFARVTGGHQRVPAAMATVSA